MFFKKVQTKLKTSKLASGIRSLFQSGKIHNLENLEELLIGADIGIKTTEKLLETIKKTKVKDEDILIELIEKELIKILTPIEKDLQLKKGLNIFLICGINGSGKTTTIAKLAHWFKDKKIGFAAADTFRAAATEQLEIWAQRVNAKLYKGQINEDPSSVAFRAINAAQEDHLDLLLIDTAGRLHNKIHLMQELEKMIRVIKKIDDQAPHEILLILDATIGANTFTQIETFSKALNISGLVMNKLDGTAKGGALVNIAEHFKTPIYFLGTGEKKEDFITFKAETFSRQLLEE